MSNIETQGILYLLINYYYYNRKPMKFDSLLSFIGNNPRSSRKLKAAQVVLRQMLFNKDRCNEIYNRRNNIIFRESYLISNHHKPPKENCSNYLNRIFVTHDPYPFKYDYEIIPTIEKSKITVLVSYYKITYYFSGYLLDNRPIKSVKETGEVKSDSVAISVSSHTNGICGPGSGQIANNPCSSRSRVASRSRTSSYTDTTTTTTTTTKSNNNMVLDDDLFFHNGNVSNNSNQSHLQINAMMIKDKKISLNSKTILSNIIINNNNTTQTNVIENDNNKVVLSPSSIKPSLFLSPPMQHTSILRNKKSNYSSLKNDCISPPLSPKDLPNFIPEDEEYH